MKLRRRCQQLGLCLFFPCLSFSFACLDPCLSCLFVVVVCFVFYHGIFGSKSFLFLFSIMECLDPCLSCLVFVCLVGWLVFVSRSICSYVFLVWFLFVWLVGWFLYHGVFGSMSSLFGFCLFVCFVYHGVFGSMSSLFGFCLFVLCITECWDPCLSCLVFVCFVHHGVLESMSSLFRFVFILVMLILMCAFAVLVLF